MELKETFDSAANLYERIRPSYPIEIAEDILSYFPARPLKALEIGCGTGKATELFIDHEVDLLCIDIGGNLLEAAKDKFIDRDNVQFLLSSFEEFKSDTRFNFIFAATSFHWIDSTIKFKKSAQLLKPDGILAVISQNHINRDRGFHRDVQKFYQSIVPEIALKHPAVEQQSEDTSPMRVAAIKEYPWSESYTAQEYIDLLGTYSDHIDLPERKREILFKSIYHLIVSDYSGTVIKDYLTRLHLYRVS